MFQFLYNGTDLLHLNLQRLSLLNDNTPYHQISRTLEAVRYGFRAVRSLWKLTCVAALLWRRLSDFRSILWIQSTPNIAASSTRVSTLFSVVKCKGDVPAMHRSCISRLVCIEPSVCYLSQIEHDVILCIHHYCACLSFSGGLHASGQIWP